MDNKEQIKARAEERGIEWLVHFTHINNVDSILKYGLLPRLQTEQLNESSGGGGIFFMIFFYLFMIFLTLQLHFFNKSKTKVVQWLGQALKV